MRKSLIFVIYLFKVNVCGVIKLSIFELESF